MLWQLFFTFFKIGAFTFGSGYAMIPLIEREVIERKKWFEWEEFRDRFAVAQSLPGPFSLNTAVFVGYKMRGRWGAVVSVLGLVVPSFVILLLIAVYLTDFRENRWVAAAFQGIGPAVVALIVVPCVRFFRGLNLWQMAVAIAVAVIIWLLGVSPVVFIFLGAVVGVLFHFFDKKS